MELDVIQDVNNINLRKRIGSIMRHVKNIS